MGETPCFLAASLPFAEAGRSPAKITPDRSCAKSEPRGRLFNEITSY
ncbi:hypothetical protein [Moorena producens]